MPDLPISGLPVVTVPSNSYTVAAVSASVTSQMTLAQVAAAISSSFTASQAVTASYAVSASYEINIETSSSYADTASYALTASYVSGSSNSISSSYALTASYAISASYAPSPVSSSYALTASFWGGGSSYVPYTGATTNVNLGGNALYADDVIVSPPGFGLLAALSRDISGAGFGSLVLKNGATGYLIPTSSLTVDRTYLLPDKNGTVAMLSDIGAAFPYTGSARITGSLDLTGSLNVTGSSILNGAFYIPSSSLFSANTGSSLVSYDTASGQLFHTPYSSALPALFSVGAFYSTGSITTTANQSGSFTYTTSLGVNSIHINTIDSHIVVDKSATYNFQFSIQIHNQSSAALIAVWLKKNGVNVPDTATYLDVASNKKAFFALNIWDTANAGDYYEIAYQADQTGVIFETVAATGNIPQSPMIILTVNQVR